MSDRNNLALLLVMLLIVFLLGSCAVREVGWGAASCNQLWMDCSGIANDYLICSQASDLSLGSGAGVWHFSYYNCLSDVQTPTLAAPKGCIPTFRY